MRNERCLCVSVSPNFKLSSLGLTLIRNTGWNILYFEFSLQFLVNFLIFSREITQNVAFAIFQFWHFPPTFVLLKVTCLVTLFDLNIQIFKNSPILAMFGIFNELLSTQNVNVARFARSVECDFFCDFQTL